MKPLEAARAYAKKGWRVFPIKPGHKIPITKRGFLDASIDADTIDAWWKKETRNIAVTTSPASGIWVLDCDVDKKTGELIGDMTLAALVAKHGPLPSHPIQRSPSGGSHHVFAWPDDDLPLVRRIKFAPGLDALAEGGYFIVWPSVLVAGAYQWEVWPRNVLPPQAPQWLLDIIRVDTNVVLPRVELVKGDTTPYGRKALDEECALIASCPPGSQSDTLIKRATRIGSLAAGGEIDHTEAYSSLLSAAIRMENGGKAWKLKELEGHIRRGMDYGAKDPHKSKQLYPKPHSRPQLIVNNQEKVADPPPAATPWMLDKPWRCNKDQSLKPKEAINCQLMIEHHPDLSGMFVYNRFTDRIIVTRGLPNDARPDYPRQLIDHDEAALVAWLNWHGIGPSLQMVAMFIREVAFRHSFDPLQDWIGTLKWDGKPRIEKWLTYYAAAPDTAYVRMVARKFLVSAAARALQPGCKVDTMLILEGRQSIGKSTLAYTLFGSEFFSDQVGDVTSKDSAERIQGTWCVEIPEMDKFSRVEANAVKSFLSHRDDRYRPAYGRNTIIRPRRCVFLGTINPDGRGYLKDKTGNRRFWPVSVESIDLAGIEADREQLWAEAIADYHSKTTWWLTQEEEATAMPEQDARRDDDVWEPKIRTWLEDRDPSAPIIRFTSADCLAGIGIDTPRQGLSEKYRIATALKLLGCEDMNNQDGFKGRFWRYERIK